MFSVSGRAHLIIIRFPEAQTVIQWLSETTECLIMHLINLMHVMSLVVPVGTSLTSAYYQ